MKISQIIKSFQTEVKPGAGLPLGNLTSQLLVNIYMNKFDQFVKRKLKVKCYIRYADDFVVLSEDKKYLESLVVDINEFLKSKLKLELHPDKLSVETFSSGIDFLGWVNFSHHLVLRTSTKKRMMRKLQNDSRPEIIASYLGLLSHGNAYDLSVRVSRIGAE